MKKKSCTINFIKNEFNKPVPDGFIKDTNFCNGVYLSEQLINKYSELKDVINNIDLIKDNLQKYLMKTYKLNFELTEYTIHNITFDTSFDEFEISIINDKEYVYSFKIDSNLKIIHAYDDIEDIKNNTSELLVDIIDTKKQ